MKVLIAFNQPAEETPENELDRISETAVENQVDAVMRSVRDLGYEPICLGVKNLEIDLEMIEQFRPDVVFNLCEGYRGSARHEMHVASIWELLGLPYTGNTPLTLGLAQDKVLSKQLFRALSVPTPDFQVFTEVKQKFELDFPVIAKPSREDASLGITATSVVNDEIGLRRAVADLLKRYRQPILVESFIDGREFNVSLLGNQPARVVAVAEIQFTDLPADQPRITSYEAKWLPDHPAYRQTPSICPAKIDAALRSRLDETALQVYSALHGRDYGRVDMRVDHSGKVFVLEYNPNPDISADAGFARALHAAGIKYSQFVSTIIEQAIARKNNDSNPKNAASRSFSNL